MFYMLKKKIYILPVFQNIIHTVKDNLFYYFNELKWRRMTLSCSKKVWKNKDFCNILMPSEDTNILEFNQYDKSVKSPLLFMQTLNV